MTKNQIAKAAAKMVSHLEFNAPTTTFLDLSVKADAAYGTDECKVLDAAIAILGAKEDAAKAAYSKLITDLKAINLQHLEDGCVATENMNRGIVEGSVFFWVTFFNADCQVVACHAESEGLAINTLLGYSIY